MRTAMMVIVTRSSIRVKDWRGKIRNQNLEIRNKDEMFEEKYSKKHRFHCSFGLVISVS